jgi:hypothetical protein
MSKRIIFHVGAPKAGSTYLQKRLKANAEALERNDLCYPVIPRFDRVAANAKNVTLNIDPSGASQLLKSLPEFDASNLDPQAALDELLELCPDQAETIVLSSEKMRPQHAKYLALLFRKRPPCEIVLIVRKQDNWLDSYYNQQVKNRNTNLDISQFLQTILKPGQLDFLYPDWLMHYQEWARQFGKTEVVFFDTTNQDLFERFAQSLGLSDIVGFREIERQNQSLSAFELIYMLDLPQDLTDVVFRQHRRAIAMVADEHLGQRERFSFLSKPDRKILIDRFQKNNDQLLQIFDAKAGTLNIEAEATSYIDVNEVRHSQKYSDFRNRVDAILRSKMGAGQGS